MRAILSTEKLARQELSTTATLSYEVGGGGGVTLDNITMTKKQRILYLEN